MLDLAIQIVNYNTKSYLTRCLDDLLRDLRSAPFRWKILVLDNHSADDLTDLLPRYGQRNVTFFHSEKNRGFGAGHNLLAAKAQSRYLLILNPDLEFLEERTIERLLDYAERLRTERVAVIGPKLMSKGGAQWWDHGELFGFWGWVSQRIGGSHWRDRWEPIEVAWVSGAFFLIRREAFELEGGFDEQFFLYKEEEDLCRRLRQRGCRIWYEPDVKVFHRGSVVAKKSQFFNAADRYFIKKHFRSKGPVVFGLVWFLSKLKHFFVNPILHR